MYISTCFSHIWFELLRNIKLRWIFLLQSTQNYIFFLLLVQCHFLYVMGVTTNTYYIVTAHNISLQILLLTFPYSSIFLRFEKQQGFTTLQHLVVQSKSLTESLQDFVRGDILEGDNRYLCGECQEMVRMIDRWLMNG